MYQPDYKEGDERTCLIFVIQGLLALFALAAFAAFAYYVLANYAPGLF